MRKKVSSQSKSKTIKGDENSMSDDFEDYYEEEDNFEEYYED